MSLKLKIWSLAEQFGGAGVFFITLPMVSREVDEVTFAIFLMSQTLIALASIYTSGAALRAKRLNIIYSERVSFFKESTLAAKITLTLAPVVLIYFLIFSSMGDKAYINIAYQAYIFCFVVACIFLEIQCSTLLIILKTRGKFRGCAIAELTYRISLVGLIVAIYRLTGSPISILFAILISYFVKFLILTGHEMGQRQIKKGVEIGFNENRSSSIYIALIYGVTSFLVANGEKILSGFLGPRELATVYSVMLLPLFIPSIFNAVRITSLANIRVAKNILLMESWAVSLLKELIWVLPIALAVYLINPIYYNKISNLDASLDLNQLNAIACFIAGIQALNIKSFYSVIRLSPEIAAKIVVFSGVLYCLTVAVFINSLGIYGVLMGKLVFYAGSLMFIPVANKLESISAEPNK